MAPMSGRGQIRHPRNVVPAAPIPSNLILRRECASIKKNLAKMERKPPREEVLSIVNGLDLPAIHEDLSFRQRRAITRNVRAADEEEHRLFERDPFIYFYEDYLKAYDPRRLLYTAAELFMRWTTY